MAVVYTKNSNSVSVRLNNGTSGGVVQTVGVSLGRLSAQQDINSGESAQKIINVVGLLGNCLALEVYSVETTVKGRLSVQQKGMMINGNHWK